MGAHRSIHLDELGHLLQGMVLRLQALQASLQITRPQLLEHAPQGPAQVPVLSICQLPTIGQRVDLWVVSVRPEADA